MTVRSAKYRRLCLLAVIGVGAGALAALSPHGALAAAESSDTAAPSKPLTHATESLETCMRKWDAGTHMTKEAWRESCLRIKREREQYVKER